MNPYLNAAGIRGEGYRVDDIDDLDRFATDAAAIDSVLNDTQHNEQRGWRGWLTQLLSMVRRKAANFAEPHENK